uniref:Secreted protein n=1 Tax=Echinostoma caproni TaxID=27848 RepID=A0A183A154_9TREM
LSALVHCLRTNGSRRITNLLWTHAESTTTVLGRARSLIRSGLGSTGHACRICSVGYATLSGPDSDRSVQNPTRSAGSSVVQKLTKKKESSLGLGVPLTTGHLNKKRHDKVSVLLNQQR